MAKKEPLHEVILRAIYLDNPEQPVLLSTDDILWKVDDPQVTGRHIKECLDWLVHNRWMEKDLGKYKLDRFKFLELKEQYEHLLEDSPAPVVVNTPQPRKRTRSYKAKKQKPKLPIFLALCILLLLAGQVYCSYNYYTTSTTKASILSLSLEAPPLEEPTKIPYTKPETATTKSLAQVLNAQRKQNQVLLSNLQALNSELDSIRYALGQQMTIQQEKEAERGLLLDWILKFMLVTCVVTVLLLIWMFWRE